MLRALCLWLAGVLSAGSALAGDADIVALLERAHMAGRRLDYRGEFILQRGLDVTHTRIVHAGSGSPERERLQSLDGEPRETLRRGVETLHYLPRQRRIVAERRQPELHFPALPPLMTAQIRRDYLMRSFPGRQVAGRDAIAIALDTRDSFHYSYRFWFDRETGLLLRTQTVDEAGEVIEQVSFRQLVIGRVPASQLTPAHGSTRGWRIDRSPMQELDLARWRLGWVPSGFVRVAAVSRRLISTGGQPRDVEQLLYSNGLSSLSVFIEPWSPELSLSPLRLGALNMVGKRQGKFWLTIVGDVPMLAIRQVADAIEFAQISPK